MNKKKVIYIPVRHIKIVEKRANIKPINFLAAEYSILVVINNQYSHYDTRLVKDLSTIAISCQTYKIFIGYCSKRILI